MTDGLRKPTGPPEPPEGYEVIDPESLASYLGELVHTGLRKGSDADDSHELWLAISQSRTSAWSDAVSFAAYCMEMYGWRIYKPVDET